MITVPHDQQSKSNTQLIFLGSKNGQHVGTINGLAEGVMRENGKVSDENGRKRRKNV